jgi:hypothetical protein
MDSLEHGDHESIILCRDQTLGAPLIGYWMGTGACGPHPSTSKELNTAWGGKRPHPNTLMSTMTTLMDLKTGLDKLNATLMELKCAL